MLSESTAGSCRNKCRELQEGADKLGEQYSTMIVYSSMFTRKLVIQLAKVIRILLY